MSETIRAFIVIMGLSIPFFLIAKKTICHLAIDEPEFLRRRNTWLAIVTFAFLSHSFWLFVILTLFLLAFVATRDTSRFSLFLFTFLAVPPVSDNIPGFGILNYLMSLSYPRLLSLVLLLPYYVILRRDPETTPFLKTTADKFMGGFLVLPLLLQAADDTLTNTLRQGVYAYLDYFLPYYVATRSLRSLTAFRNAMMSLMVAMLLLVPVALLEYLRKWLLYSSLPASMGIRWEMGSYLSRGSDLRAMATTGHALSLAYFMVIASSMYAYVRQLMHSKVFIALGVALLLGGLWAPISRGPWLGALAGLAVIYATGQNPVGRTLKLLLICSPFVIALLLSPVGPKVISVLPFVGSVDTFNEIYRQRLLDTSIEVIKMNPFFGSFTFLQLPIMQSLKTGEGIIDIVNSYLGVALTYGLVGLAMYVGVFGCALLATWRGMRQCSPGDELHVLGRALLATLIGVMITLIGVSSINLIGTMNFIVVGMCLSYGELVKRYTQGRVGGTYGAHGGDPRSMPGGGGPSSSGSGPMPPPFRGGGTRGGAFGNYGGAYGAPRHNPQGARNGAFGSPPAPGADPRHAQGAGSAPVPPPGRGGGPSRGGRFGSTYRAKQSYGSSL
jgi:O-antigen ligase